MTWNERYRDNKSLYQIPCNYLLLQVKIETIGITFINYIKSFYKNYFVK